MVSTQSAHYVFSTQHKHKRTTLTHTHSFRQSRTQSRRVLRDIMRPPTAVLMLALAASSDALTLHVKAGPDGRSIGDCPFAHAVRLVAAAKSLPLDVAPHSPSEKPAWLLEQHEGKMPALEAADGNVYTESRTIADHLDAHYPPSISESSLLASAEEVCAPVFMAFARYCKSTEDGSEADTELKKNLMLVLCKLDAHLALVGDKPFLCGGSLSMADAFLIPTLYHITVAGKAFKGFEIPSQFEALTAYYAAATSDPVLLACTPPEAMVRWGWANARGDADAVQAAVMELQ